MKYVVLPILQKKQNAGVYIDLLTEWIEEKEAKPKTKNQQPHIVNHITTGDVNAPTQFQQNSDHSTQLQQITFTKEDVNELFGLLQKDMVKMNPELKTEFLTEMRYALKNLEKARV